jgi:hypothetical protein
MRAEMAWGLSMVAVDAGIELQVSKSGDADNTGMGDILQKAEEKRESDDAPASTSSWTQLEMAATTLLTTNSLTMPAAVATVPTLNLLSMNASPAVLASARAAAGSRHGLINATRLVHSLATSREEGSWLQVQKTWEVSQLAFSCPLADSRRCCTRARCSTRCGAGTRGELRLSPRS